jgi:hypothetical protein
MIQLFLMIKLLLNLLMIFFTNIGINLAAESDQLYNNLGDDQISTNIVLGLVFIFPISV